MLLVLANQSSRVTSLLVSNLKLAVSTKIIFIDIAYTKTLLAMNL